MRDAPLTAAVTSGFTIALLVAAAYAGLAIVAVVILHAQRRAREVGFLRTLGLTDRQVGQLTLVEHGLPLLLALVIGVGLGVGLAWLIEPGLDLAAFSSPDTTVVLQVDWASIGVGRRIGRRGRGDRRPRQLVARPTAPAGACAADRRRRTGWLTMEPR